MQRVPEQKPAVTSSPKPAVDRSPPWTYPTAHGMIFGRYGGLSATVGYLLAGREMDRFGASAVYLETRNMALQSEDWRVEIPL